MTPETPVLSVILPAFNEERLLAETTHGLHKSLNQIAIKAEIIIVNDGSRDRTGAIADELARDLPGVVACHQSNQGIGGAFRNGAARATGDYLILWPADMPASAEDLLPYASRFGGADVIVGVRRARVGYNALMRVNAWVYPKLVEVLFGLRVRDVNWIHAYRRKQFERIRLTQRGIPMLVEALVRLRDNAATFVEVEVDMKARTTGTPSAARPRIMLRTLRGLFSFWRIWRRDRLSTP
jgi:glycosyltransferase involved in cell wall biosynthesis